VHVLLSAGGVPCLSYIGAPARLEQEGHEVATVSTCSAGTFVGALYCCGVSPEAQHQLTAPRHRSAGDRDAGAGTSSTADNLAMIREARASRGESVGCADEAEETPRRQSGG
jgi:predicted acylesterase/phospholipase RssA